MITRSGTARPPQLYRELAPGMTFQAKWQGREADYLVTDLIRAEPNSNQPWDYRAAINLTSGATVWFDAIEMVTPTAMEAGPA